MFRLTPMPHDGRVLCTASTAFWMPFLIHNVPRKVWEWRCFWASQQNNRTTEGVATLWEPLNMAHKTERMIQGNYQLLISAKEGVFGMHSMCAKQHIPFCRGDLRVAMATFQHSLTHFLMAFWAVIFPWHLWGQREGREVVISWILLHAIMLGGK